MTGSAFELHPVLARDGRVIGDWPLCRVLLLDDANYPWFILVPRIAGVREIYELTDPDRAQLWEESVQLSRAAMRAFNGYKLNVAALGNAVPQLHVHHIVRHTTDPAWPGPVWDKVPKRPYDATGAQARAAALRAALPPGLAQRLE